MKCPKCDTNNKAGVKFCAECGCNMLKVKKKVVNSSSKNTIKIIVLSFIFLLVLGGILIPYKTIKSNQEVPYKATEEYLVEKPYLDTEDYYEEVPYQSEECKFRDTYFNKELSSERANHELDKIICKITNFELVPVVFHYEIYVSDKEKKVINSYGPKEITIGPEQTIEKTLVSMNTYHYLGCNVETEQIEECKSITKFKDVRKERKVSKIEYNVATREVTKIRNDVLYTNVNWLFEVRMPWLGSWREEGEMITHYKAYDEIIE
jgi:hypothetical protein